MRSYIFTIRRKSIEGSIIRAPVALTVKHILVECVDLKDVRNKHFVASSIKDLFNTIEAHKIIDFIKETRFYKQL